MQTTDIAITNEQRHILEVILREFLSEPTIVWAFGSRTNGRTRLYSDLDLALERVDGKGIPLARLVDLQEAFKETDLPYKVDVLDYCQLKDGVFKKNIDVQKKKFITV